MIISFEDSCWTTDGEAWKMGLAGLLTQLQLQQQHVVLARHEALLSWCEVNLPPYVSYFRTRLATGQGRTNALRIVVSPSGATNVAGDPPWSLDVTATRDVLSQPLTVVLENDQSDQLFVAATVPAFSQWNARRWIAPAMGGGSAMERKIAAGAVDPVSKWRTFYLFDSDRLHPSELTVGWTPPVGDSCQGFKFEAVCSSLPRARWHRLERRSIENYLPPAILRRLNPATSSALFGPSIGPMANFYNVKKGLTGDGISPADPQRAVRASRSQGFWTSLSATDISSLEGGFGTRIADEFKNVLPTYAWPADVLREMDALGEALQDAI